MSDYKAKEKEKFVNDVRRVFGDIGKSSAAFMVADGITIILANCFAEIHDLDYQETECIVNAILNS